MIFNILELAIFIMLPIVLIFLKLKRSKSYLIYIIAAYGVWYLTYSFFHELCHLVTAKILQENVIAYQLFPDLLSGQLDGGFVKTIYSAKWKEFLIVLAPYLRDVILSIFGVVYFLLKPKGNIYLASSIFVLFICSSLFDVFNNYFAFILGSRNDFNALKYTSTIIVPHIIGITFTAFILFALLFSFAKINDSVKNK